MSRRMLNGCVRLSASVFVVLACGMVDFATAAPLGATTPTVYNVVLGEVDLSLFDNARNPGRISSVAMGDLNGDSLTDLLFGAPYAYGFQAVGPPEGMVYVVYGGFSPASVPRLDLTVTTSGTVDPAISSLAYPGATPPGVAGFQVEGELREMRFGSALASGDFDGDGIEDFAIAAPRRLTDQVAGRVYLIKSDAALLYMTDLAALRLFGRLITVIGPSRAGDAFFGESLLFLDFDNDGRDDLVIGSPRAGAGGEVCVLYGREFTSATIVADEVPTTDPLFAIIEAEAAGDGLGVALAAGDLSGDGRADLLVGAPLNDSAGLDAGKVYAFLGADRDTTAGLPLPSRVWLTTTPATLAVVGSRPNEAMGSAIATGDFDGDGLNDLVVGAPFASWDSRAGVGKTYLLYNDGSLTTGPRVILPDPATPGVAVFIGPAADARLGSSLAAGRFNEDSLDDLLIGVPRAESVPGRQVTGAVFAVLGRQVAERPQGEIVLNGGPGSVAPDLTIWAGDWDDRLGHDMALGQFDGSGGLELFVCGNPVAEGQSGSAWLFVGRDLDDFFPPVLLAARSFWNLYR